jgi:hypothetical protein
MRLTNGVYVLPIPRSPQEASTFLNLTLIVDEEKGITLVDAGLPDQTEAIGAALVEADGRARRDHGDGRGRSMGGSIGGTARAHSHRFVGSETRKRARR